MAETVEIYIRLLDEGTECSRPTQALDLGNGLFKVLPTSNYDPVVSGKSICIDLQGITDRTAV
jgi:hypothetical protein